MTTRTFKTLAMSMNGRDLIDVTVMTEDDDNINIKVSEWFEGRTYISISRPDATARIVLTPFEAREFLAALQAVVEQGEVV